MKMPAWVRCAKTAEPVEMPFWADEWVQGTIYYMRIQIPHMNGHYWGGHVTAHCNVPTHECTVHHSPAAAPLAKVPAPCMRRTNAFTTERGGKMAMQPFAKLVVGPLLFNQSSFLEKLLVGPLPVTEPLRTPWNPPTTNNVKRVKYYLDKILNKQRTNSFGLPLGRQQHEGFEYQETQSRKLDSWWPVASTVELGSTQMASGCM